MSDRLSRKKYLETDPSLTPDRCRFFILGWGQDKEDKEGKKTRGKNRTKLGSVKLTSKSRNALFSFSLFLVYWSTCLLSLTSTPIKNLPL
jgi:hypothetical protein